MKKEEAENYERIFQKIEELGQAYLGQLLFLFNNITLFETKSQEFGVLFSALSHGRESIHDLELYIKILRQKITELRMSHDSSKQ